MQRTILSLFITLFCVAPAFAATQTPQQKAAVEPPLTTLRDEALSFFKPLTGKVAAVENMQIRTDIGSQNEVRPGMRFHAIKEGVPFIHPVTKEVLGKLEIPVGAVEITAVMPQEAKGVITKGKPEDFSDAKIKISGAKVKMLFYQGTVDWFLGDAYYQMLKETRRFELIDTGIETDDTSKLIAEAKAKGADVLLVLSSENGKDNVRLTQRLIWVADAKQFSAATISVAPSYVKELRFKSALFGAKEGEVLLSYRLPYGARKLAVGDLNGDSNPDILIVTGSTVGIYSVGVDLKLEWEFELPRANEVLWIDVLDVNNDGRDEVIVTSWEQEQVNSYIYELKGAQISLLWKAPDTFLRSLDNKRLMGQEFYKSEGYDGDVFYIDYAQGAFKRGEKVTLPKDVNIYDFQFINAPDGRQALLIWDDSSHLNLYNEKGTRIWMSKEDFGGFSTSFTKESPFVMIDKGKWAIKDRLITNGFEVLAPKRKPLLGVAKGLGYSGSEIKSIWWSGLGVEERRFIEEIGGEVLDYALVGDRVVMLAKPLFGIKAGNILKGENPFGTMLYIFSLKGR